MVIMALDMDCLFGYKELDVFRYSVHKAPQLVSFTSCILRHVKLRALSPVIMSNLLGIIEKVNKFKVEFHSLMQKAGFHILGYPIDEINNG